MEFSKRAFSMACPELHCRGRNSKDLCPRLGKNRRGRGGPCKMGGLLGLIIVMDLVSTLEGVECRKSMIV